jgi:NADPH-dependent curcumin reductase CurA
MLINQQWIIVNPDNDLPHEQLPTAYKIRRQYIYFENEESDNNQQEDDDIVFTQEELQQQLPSKTIRVKAGDMVLKTLYVSVDPYLRIQFNKLHHSPARAGKLQISGSVLEVIHIADSSETRFKVGDVVFGYYGWQQYTVVNVDQVVKDNDLRLVNTSDTVNVPVSTALGVLGMPGQTAYFCLKEVCKVKSGETFVVSGAAGAVGSLAGQIAKLYGAHVVGIVGSEDKKQYLLDELNFDQVINYKEANDMHKMKQALTSACPKGIDVYFDNTGGYTTDAVLTMLNTFARVAIVGQISVYQNNMDDTPQLEPRFLHRLIYKRATIQGFLVNDYNDREQEFLDECFQWIKDGKIKFTQTIQEGFDQIPLAFRDLFLGTNTGKLVIKV